MNPARPGFELGRLCERQRILAPAFQRDDAPGPRTGRRIARPASLEACGQLDVGIGGIACCIDLRLVMRDRAIDTGAEGARGNGLGVQRGCRQRKPKRTIGAGADLSFGGERRRGEFSADAKAVASGGEGECRPVPCAGDLSLGAQVPTEPFIERGGIVILAAQTEHVAGAQTSPSHFPFSAPARNATWASRTLPGASASLPVPASGRPRRLLSWPSSNESATDQAGLSAPCALALPESDATG